MTLQRLSALCEIEMPCPPADVLIRFGKALTFKKCREKLH